MRKVMERSKAFHDDQLLDNMRALVQRYVQLKNREELTEILSCQLKQKFEALHNQLHDPVLKEYSSFKFLEKLYVLEYKQDMELFSQ